MGEVERVRIDFGGNGGFARKSARICPARGGRPLPLRHPGRRSEPSETRLSGIHAVMSQDLERHCRCDVEAWIPDRHPALTRRMPSGMTKRRGLRLIAKGGRLSGNTSIPPARSSQAVEWRRRFGCTRSSSRPSRFRACPRCYSGERLTCGGQLRKNFNRRLLDKADRKSGSKHL